MPYCSHTTLERLPFGPRALLGAIAAGAVVLLPTISCRRPAAKREAPTSPSVPSMAHSAGLISCGLNLRAEGALRKLGAAAMRVPLRDYGRMAETSTCYFAVAPASADDIRAVIGIAREHRIPIRTRARAHSANGSTLPRQGEIVLLTNRLNTLRFNQPGSVDSGAGIAVRDLDSLLRRHGYGLPVMNDGAAGPSVGGYLAAGGMGWGSREHGGFWENVDSVKLVSGTGDLVVLDSKHPDFPWLFGSMGQLGVVVEARLKMISVGAPSRYPLGEQLRAEDEPQGEITQLLARGPNEQERLHWFTLFIRPEQKAEADRALAELTERHRASLAFRPRYEYLLKVTRDVPPLFFESGQDFLAIGVWGDVQATTTNAAIGALEREFMALIRTKGYRRYIQAEAPGSPELYRSYFGEQLYERFREQKRRYDPEHLLNRGTVFAFDS
jgi:FAD/FMN-containing dehydrogenase